MRCVHDTLLPTGEIVRVYRLSSGDYAATVDGNPRRAAIVIGGDRPRGAYLGSGDVLATLSDRGDVLGVALPESLEEDQQ